MEELRVGMSLELHPSKCGGGGGGGGGENSFARSLASELHKGEQLGESVIK